MRLLINASTTAEGWEAYNTSSDRTKSFGIIPTQNASVVTTYTRFQKLIDESIPLLDGDAPGRSYITDLIALDNPPQTILNLGYDLELEDLISWIVQPQQLYLGKRATRPPSEKSRLGSTSAAMALQGFRQRLKSCCR